MKRICMILMTLGIIMGGLTTATTYAQEAGKTEDTMKIVYDSMNYVDCVINKVSYRIWKDKKFARAVWAAKEGSVLEIPSSVTLNGVQYPVTEFDNGIGECETLDDDYDWKSDYEEIKLPDSITKVALYDVIGKKINIPKHAEIFLDLDIDNTAVEIPADHDYYTLKDNFVYDKKDSTKIYYVLGASGNVQIPEGVEYVGSLLKNSKIEGISLPSTLKEIGKNFARQTEMKTVDLSGTKLKEVPENAFFLSDLQNVKLPRTLRSIGRRAFAGCNLKKVIIPDKVTRIKAYAFSTCSKLQKIILGKKVEKIASGAFADTAIREITFPASVKIIYYGALSGNNKLRKVTFMHKKKLPYFSGSTPMVQYYKPNNKKVTFCVKNKKMKSGLNKKLKKEKLKSKTLKVPGIKRWQIKIR